jgi:hypothetical protein
MHDVEIMEAVTVCDSLDTIFIFATRISRTWEPTNKLSLRPPTTTTTTNNNNNSGYVGMMLFR